MRDLAQFDVAFEHDLGVRRHLQVRRLAPHHLDRLAAQEAGDHHLVQVRRQREDGGVHGGRVGADGHGHIHAPRIARLEPPAIVLGALLVGLPVHARGALVVDLHAVHAAVALAGVRVPGEDQRQGDEAAAVVGPALQDRVVGQREAVAPDDFLAGPAGNRLREERTHLGELGQHLELADQPFRHAHLQVLRDAAGHLVHRGHLQRDLHLPHAGEAVDEDRHAGALGLLEQAARGRRA